MTRGTSAPGKKIKNNNNKKEEEEEDVPSLFPNDFDFICAGVSNVGGYKRSA